MGIYTRHVIRIINEYNTRKNLGLLWKALRKTTNYLFTKVGSAITDANEEGYKWYHFHDDMVEISEKYPKFEISIMGRSEEGKEWSFIYQNGEQFHSELMFEEPDDESDFYDETESNHCSDCFVSSDSEYSENEECEECEED